MKFTIDTLKAQRMHIRAEREAFLTQSTKDQDSHDPETLRKIQFHSLYEQVICNLDAAIAQLEIINHHLY
jgi:hypothetical protein